MTIDNIDQMCEKYVYKLYYTVTYIRSASSCMCGPIL